MVLPKLNKWHLLKTRFMVVPAKNKPEDGYDKQAYRIIIEFPEKLRKGWYPYEIQLRTGFGSTNYWVNPFADSEIRKLIEAILRINTMSRRFDPKIRQIEWNAQMRSRRIKAGLNAIKQKRSSR